MASPTDVSPPEPAEAKCWSSDRFAVALGNASLLGVGYAMAGRRGLAVANALVSAVLLIVLASVEGAGWLALVVVAWWALVVGHGWLLAARQQRRPGGVLRARLVAALFTVPVLVAFLVLRVDTGRMVTAAAAAHRGGDCEKALSTVHALGPAHRMADAPAVDDALDGAEPCELVVRAHRQAKVDRLLAARTVRAYEDHPEARWAGASRYRADLLLDQAAGDLRAGLRAYSDELAAGFDLLPRILREFPDRETDVDGVLEDFLGGLPVADPCVTVTIMEWILDQHSRSDELGRAAEIVPRIAPAAIVECGDQLMAQEYPADARSRYAQLVTEYPDDDLVSRARKGITRATLAVELIGLRSRLTVENPGELPPYCQKPVAYHGAKPYRGGGPHRVLLFGQNHLHNLPAPWRAKDATDAAVVICAGDARLGDAVETCQYTPTTSPGVTRSVTFHKRKIPVRVYEVRTGRLVASTGVQIGGRSCPQFLDGSYGDYSGPPPDQYVTSSGVDVRAAYQPLVDP